MTSIIRSDVSRSTGFINLRAGSAGSVVDHLTNAKHVTQLSAVIGNGVRDSALQINGHVTDKINNLNFKYLIIPCHCEVVRAVVSTRVGPPHSAAVPLNPRVPAPVKRSIQFNAVSSAEISPLLKNKQNETLISKVTGQEHIFCVIFPRKVYDNFISLELVTRLDLETHFDVATSSSITWESKRFSSTGEFVYLSLPTPGNAKIIAQRFLVVEDCPFDVLQGIAATDSFLS